MGQVDLTLRLVASPCVGIPSSVPLCDGHGMTDDRRPRTPWFVWLILGVAALFCVLRFALHAVSHLVDLVSTVVVLGVLGLVGWKVAVGGRREPAP